jgi:hypothetical protein
MTGIFQICSKDYLSTLPVATLEKQQIFTLPSDKITVMPSQGTSQSGHLGCTSSHLTRFGLATGQSFLVLISKLIESIEEKIGRLIFNKVLFLFYVHKFHKPFNSNLFKTTHRKRGLTQNLV